MDTTIDAEKLLLSNLFGLSASEESTWFREDYFWDNAAFLEEEEEEEEKEEGEETVAHGDAAAVAREEEGSDWLQHFVDNVAEAEAVATDLDDEWSADDLLRLCAFRDDSSNEPNGKREEELSPMAMPFFQQHPWQCHRHRRRRQRTAQPDGKRKAIIDGGRCDSSSDDEEDEVAIVKVVKRNEPSAAPPPSPPPSPSPPLWRWTTSISTSTSTSTVGRRGERDKSKPPPPPPPQTTSSSSRGGISGETRTRLKAFLVSKPVADAPPLSLPRPLSLSLPPVSLIGKKPKKVFEGCESVTKNRLRDFLETRKVRGNYSRR